MGDLCHHKQVRDLDAAVRLVFETMTSGAMTNGDVVSREPTEPMRNGLTAEVRFGTPCAGVCRLHIEWEAARSFCLQFTGLDEAALIEDTARELCNIIAGGWKSMQPGAHGVMTPPVLTASQGRPDGGWRCYAESESGFCVQLLLDVREP